MVSVLKRRKTEKATAPQWTRPSSTDPISILLSPTTSRHKIPLKNSKINLSHGFSVVNLHQSINWLGDSVHRCQLTFARGAFAQLIYFCSHCNVSTTVLTGDLSNRHSDPLSTDVKVDHQPKRNYATVELWCFPGPSDALIFRLIINQAFAIRPKIMKCDGDHKFCLGF